MAACGLSMDIDDLVNEDDRVGNRKVGMSQAKNTNVDIYGRSDAPDGLPPLSLPFVIVDEACQSVEPATLIPLTASNSCRSLVLLGDPCQLPATVKSDTNSELSVSLMERLASTLPAPMINMKNDAVEMDSTYLNSLPIKQARSLMRAREENDKNPASYRKRFAGSLLLNVQYRMHPSIAAFSSSLFYDSLLQTPSFLASYRPFPEMLNQVMPCTNPSLGVRMIDIGGRCNEERGEVNKFTKTMFGSQASSSTQESTTYRNEAEAVRVVTLVRDILKGICPDEPSSPKSIGIVTPYSGQVQLIKSLIANDPEIVLMMKNPYASVEVNSVDGYQGRERDIVIFSAVRSNRQGNVGFLSDWRRLNVALTRARTALVVVGDSDTLANGDKHWAAFQKWCEGAGCIVENKE